MRTLALMLLVGCVHKVKVTEPLHVEPLKVTLERADQLLCYLEDPPEPPQELSLNYESEDEIVRRVFVHKLDYNDMVTWAQAMRAWASDLKACVEK